MTTAREWLDDMEQMTDPDCCSECARTRLVIAALRAVLDLCDADDRMFAESWDVEAVIRWSPEVRRRIDAALGTVTP